MSTSSNKHRTLPRTLLIDSLGATIAIFLICGILKKVVFNISFLDPVHSALHHVSQEFDNHVHAGTLASAKPFSPAICLVNIGSADRSQIAAMLNVIAQQQPRVVGVDVVFDRKGESTNPALQEALAQLARQQKLVMASWMVIEGEKEHSHTDVVLSDAPYQVGPTGYTNFIASPTDGVVRHFLPSLGKAKAGRADTLSFAAQILVRAAPASWQSFRAGLEPNQPVRILYQPDSLRFLRLSAIDLTGSSPKLTLMRDAIVLVGSMAGLTDRYVAEDVHPVPTSEEARLAGLEIHANIVAMLLQRSYMHHVPDWLVWLLSFPVCFVLMVFFIKQFIGNHRYFHLFFKGVQFSLAVILVLIGLCLFRFAHTEVNVVLLLIPVALSVDILYFYESFSKDLSRWLTKKHRKKSWTWLHYTSYFNEHEHAPKLARRHATYAGKSVLPGSNKAEGPAGDLRRGPGGLPVVDPDELATNQ